MKAHDKALAKLATRIKNEGKAKGKDKRTGANFMKPTPVAESKARPQYDIAPQA